MGAEGLGARVWGSGRWHGSITKDLMSLSPCSQQPLVTLTPPLCPFVPPQVTRMLAEPLPPAPGTGTGLGTPSSSARGRWEASPGADPAPGRLEGGRRRGGGSPKPTPNLPGAGRTEGSRAVRLSSPPSVLLRPPAVSPGPPGRSCWLGHGNAEEICPKLGEEHWVGGDAGGSGGGVLARGDNHDQMGWTRTFMARFVLISFCFN